MAIGFTPAQRKYIHGFHIHNKFRYGFLRTCLDLKKNFKRLLNSFLQKLLSRQCSSRQCSTVAIIQTQSLLSKFPLHRSHTFSCVTNIKRKSKLSPKRNCIKTKTGSQCTGSPLVRE